MDNYNNYMSLALRSSLKGQGQTSPNPIVGAVIVKNRKIIAKGFHKRAGGDHAEVMALKKAGLKAKNATLYVTLEPCSSSGRTPPCTQAIIKSKIKKVVIGMLDPNPIHRGKGVSILKRNSIKVHSGVMAKTIRMTNQPFIKYISKGMPYTTLKIAQSIDGKIATKTGSSKWITSLKTRRYTHKLRNNFDAIMVGINTVLKDNPVLNPSGSILKKEFFKIILDTSLKIKNNLRIYKDIKRFPVIIATSKKSFIANKKKISLLVKKGVSILGVEEKNNLLDLKDLFKKLAQFEIANILVEGGGRVIGSLIDNNIIDYVLFCISPGIIGGIDSISSIQGEGVDNIRNIRQLQDLKITQIDRDILIEGRINKY